MKVRIQRHEKVEGHSTFTISLPIVCGKCGYHFTRRLQVGVNDPTIPCPVCYCRSSLRLSWKLKEDRLADGDIVEVIIHE